MFSQVQQALECLVAALDGVQAAPTGELRRTLEMAKQLRSRVELLETKAASAVAQRERHGDGGAGLLNQVGGRSRSEAARNVRTDAELAVLPEARTAVSEGEICLANASKLAQAARKTSPDAVQADPELVQMAKTLPEDEFAQAAQRWTIRHQSADDLAAQHRRNRRNRSVRFWNGEDGSVQMRGSFDAEMGARIQQRLRRQAELLRQADRRRQTHSQPPGTARDGGDSDAGSVPEAAVRTRDQRMADALDTLLANSAAATHAADTPTPRSEPAGTSESTQTPQTNLLAPPKSDTTIARGDCETDGVHRVGPQARGEHTAEAGPQPSVGHKATAAEIIVRADLAAFVGTPGGVAEICGIGPIPPDTLQRLACNADVSVEIFGDNLTPLYETVASRAPTAAQRRALIARDGACIGCGEPPGECEAHHITPCQRGGKTRLDNLVLVCWRCHDLIHDHNWQVTIRDGRYRLAPPDPAHAAEPAPQRKPKRRAPQHSLELIG
ncbi:HNH endonuclease [Candidatus Poriferisodalis sp.]|uniref:HNH endonuclease signature motif containing protein n=1 Tax=Candidatus Poriferisodalis sp. TaxID=3101277 RepID=UPI003B0261F0